MLKRVHFAGIKSLLDVSIDLERFTVLVGPNGCGKSTVLDQIELVCFATKAEGTPGPSMFGPDFEAPEGIGIRELRSASTKMPMLFEAEDSDGRWIAVQVQAERSRPWHKGIQIDARTPEGVETVVEADAWRPQRLALVPGAIATLCPVRNVGLRRDGFGLAAVLAALARNNRSAYAALQHDLAAVVPGFEEIQIDDVDLEPQGFLKPAPGFQLSLRFAGAGILPARHVSDGTLLALGLLTAAHDRRMANILLMDDIDHGLHLSAQYQIIEAIRRVMAVRADLQVICTTHSPILLDSFKPEEVRVMALDKEGHTHVRPLTDHPQLDEWRTGLGTGELWANLGEAWVLDA